MYPSIHKLCSKPISPHLGEKWEYMSCFVNIYCTVFLLFQVSPLVCRSWYGSWIPVSIVLGSLYNVWMVKPLVVIFLSFHDIKGGREDLSLIRVNESVPCTCCSEALLSLIHITVAAEEHITRAPWCGPRVLYLYRLLQGVWCRVNPDSAASAFTKPLHEGKTNYVS